MNQKRFFPLTTFVGRGVYVDFKDTVAPYTHITAADLDREASKVREGDIVIIDSSYKLEPFTSATNTEVDKRLLIGEESANKLTFKLMENEEGEKVVTTASELSDIFAQARRDAGIA